jgi:hypothetical protein
MVLEPYLIWLRYFGILPGVRSEAPLPLLSALRNPMISIYHTIPALRVRDFFVECQKKSGFSRRAEWAVASLVGKLCNPFTAGLGPLCINITTSVVYFLATDPEVPGSIPGPTRFSE